MIAATPGMPAGDGADGAPGSRAGSCAVRRLRACARRRARRAAAAAAAAPPARAGARSAVSATMHRFDARHGADRGFGALAHRFPGLTAPASTVIEKNTLPSLTTMSDSLPVAGSGAPSGPETLPSAARTSSFRMSCDLHSPDRGAVNLAVLP